jgi:hypothetical protein
MLTIAVPCAADWSAMEPIAGDRRARLCRSCDKPVYDSKSMTRAELYALIEKTEGKLPCLQLHQRPDGTIVTKGCLSAIYRSGRYLWLKAAALAFAFWTSVLGLRRACDRLMTPAIVSIDIDQRIRTTRGMGTFLVRPKRRPKKSDYVLSLGLLGLPRHIDPPPPQAPAPPKKPDIDHAPPLRVLESEKDLLPPGWRD